MTSNTLNHLRERLNKLKKRSVDTFTFDITDAKKWVKQNRPEEWLEYIQHVTDKVEFPDEYTQFNFLSQLYDQAFQDIVSADNKCNESYARLFVNHGKLLSKFAPGNASMIYLQARAICRRFAMVHIASAQYELDLGNPEKAKKILEKAKLFEATPREDLDLALKQLDEGNHVIFKTPPQLPSNNHGDLPRPKGSTSSDSSEELPSLSHLSDNISANLSNGLSMSFHQKPEKHKHIPKRLPSSVQKPMMRTFRSTPLLNSEKRTNILPPARRVRRIDLPRDPSLEEEEEMNTMDSFKPLDGTKGVSFSSHAHTSGYLSMSSMTVDSTIPMETTKPPEIPIQPPEPIKEVPVKPQIMETPQNKGIPPQQAMSTPMPNMEYITVSGVQYAVLGVKGKGGSSKVYQVFDGNIKAIKCVDLNSANDIIVEGYKNEIKLLKRLQYCDKVIKMYDSEYKEEENMLYVVMECGNDDLATFFRSQTKNRKPLSDNLIRFYWEVMLEAVQALHKEGIIHSDLKPANFLLVGGNLKLIDFGIAKALQQDRTSVILETQIGTLNYMSPEAIMDSCGDAEQGKPQFKISVKSDVWSLGCILYNMVYGRTPFQNMRNDFMKLQAIMNPDFPIQFPDIPNKHLIDVLKRCLTRDPKLRPSIDELLSHPYLRASKEDAAGMTPPPKEKCKDKKVEALINTLSEQYALSPGGILNLIHKSLNTQQNTPPECDIKGSESGRGSVEAQRPKDPFKSLGHGSKSEPQVKHIRTPLTSLNLSDLQGNDPVERQRQFPGS